MSVVTTTPTDQRLLHGHHLVGHTAGGQRTTVLVGEKEQYALNLLESELGDLRRAVQEGNTYRIRDALEEFQKAAAYGAEILTSAAGLLRCQECSGLVPHDGYALHKRQLCKGRKSSEPA